MESRNCAAEPDARYTIAGVGAEVALFKDAAGNPVAAIDRFGILGIAGRLRTTLDLEQDRAAAAQAAAAEPGQQQQ